ncbi:hypothetical protein [Microbacterium sp. GXF0217]
MNEHIDAVFFDLDGTLVHDGAGDAVRQTAQALARRHSLDAEAILASNAEVWSGCWAEQGSGGCAASWPVMRCRERSGD